MECVARCTLGTDEHRLVYKLVEDEIRIAACRYHYGR
ncbi:type II toxin-antitoxin system YoeB family toxin [Streptomyces hypolithicus]